MYMEKFPHQIKDIEVKIRGSSSDNNPYQSFKGGKTTYIESVGDPARSEPIEIQRVICKDHHTPDHTSRREAKSALQKTK